MYKEDVSQDILDLNIGSAAYQKGDFSTAIMYYRKSAAAGNVTALSNLGYCYYYGRSIPRDKEMAKKCWEKAAILGDIAAVYKLGDMYRNGDLQEDLEYSHALYVRAFQMAVECEDCFVYPDAYLRMLRCYPAEAHTEFSNVFQIANACVCGLEERIEEGDNYSGKLLLEAKQLLAKLYCAEAERLFAESESSSSTSS